MSEIIKVGYRGIGGFFVIIFIFTFGVVGIALLGAGAGVLAFSWVPLAFPEAIHLEESDSPWNDPVFASLAMLLVAVILIPLGAAFAAIAFYIAKGAIYLDRSLSQAVDKSVPSVREITAGRSSDRISRLERIGALKDSGVLTEEEFQREKAYIMKEPAPSVKIPTCSSCGGPIEQDDIFCPRCGSKLSLTTD